MKIGFFDSGIGGITVLNEAMQLLENVDYLYYADTKNVPYGTKDKEKVKKYIFEAVAFIMKEQVDGLVIACNTATSIAIKELRRKYGIPIIGMEPAVKPAVEKCGGKRVLVLATPLTLKEDKFEDLVAKVDPANIVDSLPLPELVDFAERQQFDQNIVKEYLSEKLQSFDLANYGTIVLGCTHFVYYKNILKNILPAQLDIIDGNQGTIRHLANVMNLDLLTGKGFSQNKVKISFFISGIPGNPLILNDYLAVLH